MAKPPGESKWLVASGAGSNPSVMNPSKDRRSRPPGTTPWQGWSTSGTPMDANVPRAARSGPRSVIGLVLQELGAESVPFRHCREGVPLGPPNGQVGAGQQVAQRLDEDLVTLEEADGLLERDRIPMRPCRFSLPVRERGGIHRHGLGSFQLAFDPVQARSDQGAEGKVGVAGGV